MTTAADACLNTVRAPLRRALALALVLVSAPVSLPLAAQAPQQAQTPTAEQPDSQQAQAEEQATETPDPLLEQPAVGEATPAEAEDPFDYEASEQISEDLSVSFPVDI